MGAPQGLRLSRRGRLVVAGIALLALAGCDGGATGLAAQSASLLHDRVAAVRAAADSDDREAAVAAVEAFRSEVQRALDAGELSQAQATSLLAHADAIAAGVVEEILLPTPTPTPTPMPTVSPEPTPVPTMSPDQVQVLGQETADRLEQMLRERLTEYVKQQIEARKAEERAQAEREKAERKKAREAQRDRQGGHDEN